MQAQPRSAILPPDIEAVLDTAALEPLVTLGVLAKIGQLYLTLVPSLVEGVGTAVQDGDLATVTDICHQLKSSSANVGAIAFSGECRRLESAALANDLEGCKDAVADFAEAGQAAMQALETYLATNDRGI